MTYLQNLLELEAMMFLMITLGVICVKTGLLTETGQREITDIVIYVVFPCYILDCFIKNIGAFSGASMFNIIFASAALQLLTIFLSSVLYRRTEPGRRTILRYTLIVSNSGFLGFPLVGSVFGPEGLIFASIFLIFQRINNFSYALSLFTAAEKKGLIRRTLTHPCIFVTFIGTAIMLLEWAPPALLCKTLSSIGACSTPMSMMMIGAVLAAAKGGNPADRLTAGYTLWRLILIPGIIFLLCRALQMDQIVTGTSVLLAGMPAGTLSVMLGKKYNADAAFASRLVIVTTILSLITIPMWCMLCVYL